MFNFLKLLSILIFFTIVGCAPKIEDIAKKPPASGTFEQALFDNYLELATLERDEYDRRDSNHFRRKAIRLAEGKPVAPDEMSERDIPDDKIAIMRDSRKRLMTAFDNGGKLAAPVDAAKAQSSFDCWMQEQEENHQPDDISNCQNNFIAAMGRIDDALAENEEKMAEPEPAPAPAPEIMAMPDPVVIYFIFDTYEVDELAMTQIEDIVAMYKESGASALTVGGHTDTSGGSKYNDRLAMQRADAVRDALISKGISATAISTASFGQKMPAIITADNVREAQNRRVEVRFIK